MNNDHLSKDPNIRRAYARKLNFTDGHKGRYYTANDLMSLLDISRQHAYRIISDPEKLTKQQRELLLYKDLRALPDWGPGWYVENEGLRAPNGYLITANDMDYQSMTRQYISTLQQKNDSQAEEIAALRRQLEWLQDRLSRPKSLQSAPPRLHIVK